MEEGQERDASAVEEAHVIDDDDDDEDSTADTPDLWRRPTDCSSTVTETM